MCPPGGEYLLGEVPGAPHCLEKKKDFMFTVELSVNTQSLLSKKKVYKILEYKVSHVLLWLEVTNRILGQLPTNKVIPVTQLHRSD